ncbi:MAG: PEP-CTERM sorting domain-containing protein [Verrucomicrobiota bacterium]
MKKSIAGIVMAVVIAVSAHAQNVLVDAFTDNNLNDYTIDQNGSGFQSKAFWGAGPSSYSLQTVQTFGSNGVDSFGIAQTISVGSLTGNQLRLQFDWTPDATATQTESLNLYYQLIGWDTGGLVPAAGEEFFTGMNFFSATTGGEARGLPAGTHTYDLVTGNSTDTANGGSLFVHPDGRVFTSNSSISSAAGVLTSFDQTFSVAVGANSDLADYDYIGVRFHVGDGSANSTDAGNDGGALISSISLTVVPEPSSFALLATGMGALLLLRRRSI